MKKAQIQTLKIEFEALSMNDSEHLDDFYMNSNMLVTNIRALGEIMKKSYVVKKLLRVVPEKFLKITSMMEHFSDQETMTVEEAIGALKAHKERTKRRVESDDSQLMLKEEEWQKRESNEGTLLFTRAKWLKRTNKGVAEGQSSQFKSRVVRDKSRVKCVNCYLYGHFAAECRKPKRNREERRRQT